MKLRDKGLKIIFNIIFRLIFFCSVQFKKNLKKLQIIHKIFTNKKSYAIIEI